MRKVISLFILCFGIAGFSYADPPKKVLKLTELKPDTKAIGFSVFKGVEPEPFNVILGQAIDNLGTSLILARIYGKTSMDTPLEKMGAISGMSGSPIFIDCSNSLDDCIKNGTLVGALSYSIGSFIEGGSNVLLTPAEYMLGAAFEGYVAAARISSFGPNKILIGEKEFTNLIFFPGLESSALGVGSSGKCDNMTRGELKPGSMVSVFLAKGDIPLPVSGTVTWRDNDKIYIFGHPFLGNGLVSYPFTHIAVADTLQTPLRAHKFPGCSLDTEGSMLVDGAHEMAGVIGRVSPMIPYRVEIKIDDIEATLNEQIAAGPMTRSLVNRLPQLWATRLFGDIESKPLSYILRVALRDEPEIFLKNIIPAKTLVDSDGDVVAPFPTLFDRLDMVFKKLSESGLKYRVEGISVHVDFVDYINVWHKKTSFLSKDSAVPGEMIYFNIILQQASSDKVKQISIPIKIPSDFLTNRVGSGDMSVITVKVQSSLKLTDRRPVNKPKSMEGFVSELKKTMDLPADVLYVQQILPRSKSDRKTDKEKIKSLVKKTLDWTDVGEAELKNLPPTENIEVIFSTTPPLESFIDLDVSLNIPIGAADIPADSLKTEKKKKWFLLFLK